jgi:hypothetical protein
LKELTKAEFVAGYELGYISDIIVVGNRLYGKDPRGCAGIKRFEVVYCDLS